MRRDHRAARRPARRDRRRSSTLDRARARRDDDRPPARGVFPVARRGRRRARSCCASKSCRARRASRDVSFSVRAGEVRRLRRARRRRPIRGRAGALRPRPAMRPARSSSAASASAHSTPAAAIALGIGLVPEDRKRQGLVLSMSVLDNTTLAILPRLARAGLHRRAPSERAAAQPYFERLRVKTPRLDTPAAALSGGNQQKIVLTKWLAARVSDPDPRRADARRRRRREGRDSRAHRRARAAGQRHHPDLERAARDPQPLDAHPRLSRRPRRRRAAARRRRPRTR